MTTRSGHLPVGVVGAGLGGLAAACTLAARGYSVILFERSPWLGGKAALLQQQGFRFDTGPTVLTLPSVLHRLFAESSRPLGDFLELNCPQPQWRYFSEDGSTLDLLTDTAATNRAIQRHASSPHGDNPCTNFANAAGRLRSASGASSPERQAELLREMFGGLVTLAAGGGKGAPSRSGAAADAGERSVLDRDRVAGLLQQLAAYISLAPQTSPPVLGTIACTADQEGTWYPVGGTRAVPLALERFAAELGVEVRVITGVRRIVVRDGFACGVETDDGERVDLSAVVSNADPNHTLRELLGRNPWVAPARDPGSEPSCSSVVFYWGLNQAYDQLLHHNVVISRDPHEEFDWVYRRGEPAPDPTAYVCAPARSDRAVAPPGGEALYVLVHAPALRPHHDWGALLPAYRRVILEKLKRCAGLSDLEQRIVFEASLTPEGINDRYHILNGAMYGWSSRGGGGGLIEPGNRSSELGGLYFAGAAAQPGAGMPMALMSGWIAANAVDEDLMGGPGPQENFARARRSRLVRAA